MIMMDSIVIVSHIVVNMATLIHLDLFAINTHKLTLAISNHR
jgi:hypothetical protein